MIRDDCARFLPESMDQTQFYYMIRQNQRLFRTQKVAKLVQLGELPDPHLTNAEPRAQSRTADLPFLLRCN